jgi:hypothetical protein
MVFEVIDNPDLARFRRQSGFTNFQFKRLAGLYSRAASARALYDMAVDVDFETQTCSITYYQSNARRPFLQFLIKRVGPHTDMYEVYKEGKGRICKSGLFNRAFGRLEEEVEGLM